MTQKNTADKPVVAKDGAENVPNVPLGLVPVYMWWRENGRQFLTNAAVVLLVAGVIFATIEWRKNRIANANQEFRTAQSIEELGDFVSKYGSMKIANAARLRLAAAYFDAGRYEEAFAAYQACLTKGVPNGFAEVAQMGRAHTLEALKRLDDAHAAYSAFAATYPTHFLTTQAQMGLARVTALDGKKDEAKRLLETLKAEKTGEPMVEMAITQLEGVIDRYEPRAVRSLFERADEAAKELAAPVAPAAETETP